MSSPFFRKCASARHRLVRRRNVDSLRNMGRRPCGAWLDVEFEYLGRYSKRAARIRNVHDATDPALHRRGAENHVGLLACITELFQILDRIQARPAISDVRIQIMLLAGHLVDRYAFEDQIFRESRLDRAGLENRIDDAVFLDPIFY
jgi:hypothetical protein